MVADGAVIRASGGRGTRTAAQPQGRFGALKAQSTRRVLLLTALGGLLIAGVVTALPINIPHRLGVAATPEDRPDRHLCLRRGSGRATA